MVSYDDVKHEIFDCSELNTDPNNWGWCVEAPQEKTSCPLIDYASRIIRIGRKRKKRYVSINEIKSFINQYKVNRGCQRCGYNLHPSALDFHHVGDDKENNMARMVHSATTMKEVTDEIDKCIVLCSNCHRIEHVGAGSKRRKKC